MRLKEVKPVFSLRKRDGLSLSGEALFKLLEAVMEKKAAFRFQAKGFSMWPFIKDGDVVTAYPLLGASPGRGEAVAFIHPGTEKLVIHRVVDKKGNRYVVKGDNTSEIDGLITRENILGRVTKVERDGRKVFLGLGPERPAIAFLSKSRLLNALFCGHRLISASIRRFLA